MTTVLTRHDGTTVPVEQLGLTDEEIIVMCTARLIFEGLEAAGATSGGRSDA